MDEEEEKISCDATRQGEAKKSVEELELLLNEALKKNDEYLSMLQRLQADFENYKKRMIREREELLNLAESELVFEMLDVLDNLERGLASEKNEALSLLYAQLKKILTERGLSEIENMAFDPYYHEAIATASDPEKSEDAIIEVLKKGYVFKGKVIRHSQVVVNKTLSKEKP